MRLKHMPETIDAASSNSITATANLVRLHNFSSCGIVCKTTYTNLHAIERQGADAELQEVVRDERPWPEI